MGIESDADRASFINADEFGTTAVYTPAAGAASDPFAGQFDDPSRMSGLGEIGAVDTSPSFFCRALDLPGAADSENSDMLAVAGHGTFLVTSIEPDGTGMVLLRLGAAS
jgi:hypothetical protein